MGPANTEVVDHGNYVYACHRWDSAATCLTNCPETRWLCDSPHWRFRALARAKVSGCWLWERIYYGTCFEVLEHVPDLQASVLEIIRVCKPGGTIVISVPQVWFPFENHGMHVGK